MTRIGFSRLDLLLLRLFWTCKHLAYAKAMYIGRERERERRLACLTYLGDISFFSHGFILRNIVTLPCDFSSDKKSRYFLQLAWSLVALIPASRPCISLSLMPRGLCFDCVVDITGIWNQKWLLLSVACSIAFLTLII